MATTSITETKTFITQVRISRIQISGINIFAISSFATTLLMLMLAISGLVYPTNANAVIMTITNCADLQAKLDSLTDGEVLELAQVYNVTCYSFDRLYGDIQQRQPLIIPEGITLDLSGSHLRLDLDNGSYGVRLSRRSHIRNGLITVEKSCQRPQVPADCPGSQGIFHSAISIGAAFGHGGTAEQPNYHSEIYGWSIENMQLSQNKRDKGAVIAISSSAYDGLIRNVTINDSDKASQAISFNAGTVGENDDGSEALAFHASKMCSNREKFLANKAYTTHPHDIHIEDVTINRLTRPALVNQGTSAGVRISGGHDITVDGLTITETTFAAIALDAGDVGYEFAREPERSRALQGLEFRNIEQSESGVYGVYVNGAADNVYRAKVPDPVTGVGRCDDGEFYDSLLDPQYTMEARFLNVSLRGNKNAYRNALGSGNPQYLLRAAGVRTQCVRGVVFESMDIADFVLGVDLADGTYNSTFWRSEIQQNLKHGINVAGSPGGIDWCPTEPSGNVVVNNAILSNYVHNNGTYCNGCTGFDWAGINIGNSYVTDISSNEIGDRNQNELQRCGIRKTAEAITVRLNNNVINDVPSYGSYFCGF